MKISSAALLTTLALFFQESTHAFVNQSPFASSLKKSSALAAAEEFRSAGATTTSTAPNVQGVGGSPVLKKAAPSTTTNKSSKKEKSSQAVTIQGKSLRTWSFGARVDRVQVVLSTEGRPLNADVDLWQGPDNTPQKIALYIEDGSMRPFDCILETPGAQNTVAVRNTASMEYPMAAEILTGGTGTESGMDKMSAIDSNARIIQGGAIKTYTFGAPVGSIQVLLKTDGRPLNARLELLQGPNNNKQVIDLYTEDGVDRPFYSVIQTPGSGNVVRIINTATMEYPLTASVEPFSVEAGYDSEETASFGWDQKNDSTYFFIGSR